MVNILRKRPGRNMINSFHRGKNIRRPANAAVLPVSGDSKPPFVPGPKADGIHLCAFNGTMGWTTLIGPFSLHPQGFTVSSASGRPHRCRIIAFYPGPCRFCAIATTLAVCPCGHLRVQVVGGLSSPDTGGGRPSSLTGNTFARRHVS